MFDNPKKELRRLEEALLSEEWNDQEEYEENWECHSGDNGNLDDFPEPNAAVDFGRFLYDDEEFVEDRAVMADNRSKRAKKQAAKKEQREFRRSKRNKTKKKAVGRMLIPALLKMIAIVLILRWCVQWLT